VTGPPSRTRADQKWPHDGQTYHARSRVLPESGSVGSRHSGHSIVGPIGLGRFDPMTTTSEGGLVLDGRGSASVQNLPSSERKRRSGVRPRARACSVVKPCSVAPLLATGVLTWLRNLFPSTVRVRVRQDEVKSVVRMPITFGRGGTRRLSSHRRSRRSQQAEPLMVSVPTYASPRQRS
jgi:hypothetical protein